MNSSAAEVYLLCLFVYFKLIRIGLTQIVFVDEVATNFATCVNMHNSSVASCICSAAKALEGVPVFDGIADCSYVGKLDPEIKIQPLHCLTFDNRSQTIVAGKCPFVGKFLTTGIVEPNVNVSELNDNFCGPSNRSETLCGKCVHGTSLVINSFGFKCVNESTQCHRWMWSFYILLQLVPSAIFFILVVTFNVRTTAAYSNGFILFAQTVSIPINLVSIERDWTESLSPNSSSLQPLLLAKAVSCVYSLWNLDISLAFPGICVGQHLNTLDVLAIQYATAVFPLLLIALAYALIEMHGRNCRLVVALWKPFSCCVRMRRRIDPKNTVIDIFATFLLLSYTKFTLTSLMILAPARLHLVTGKFLRNVFLYDGSVEYFTGEHLPYALAAIFVLVFISLPPPLLLLCYQTLWFQKCLNCCWKKKQIAVYFANAFQGCFKNGTNGTCDCRFFAAIYFLLRIIFFSIYAFIPDYYILYFSLQTVLIITCGLFIVFRPYKRDIFNIIDPLLLLLYINITSATVQNMVETSQHGGSLGYTIYLYISIFVPMLYVLVYLAVWLTRKVRGKARTHPQHCQLPPSPTALGITYSEDQPSSIPFSPRGNEVLIDPDDERFPHPYIFQRESNESVLLEDSFEDSDMVHESLEYMSEGDTTPLTGTVSSLGSSGNRSRST